MQPAARARKGMVNASVERISLIPIGRWTAISNASPDRFVLHEKDHDDA
jgi:hypothetical protein